MTDIYKDALEMIKKLQKEQFEMKKNIFAAAGFDPEKVNKDTIIVFNTDMRDSVKESFAPLSLPWWCMFNDFVESGKAVMMDKPSAYGDFYQHDIPPGTRVH